MGNVLCDIGSEVHIEEYLMCISANNILLLNLMHTVFKKDSMEKHVPVDFILWLLAYIT